MKVVKRGKIITYSGVGVFGVGSSLFAVGSYYGLMLGGVGFFTGLSEEGEELLINMVNMIIAGSVMSGVGILATIIGIGDTRVGYRKMDVVVEAYNNQKGYLAFGPTSNGIGLCYRF